MKSRILAILLLFTLTALEAHAQKAHAYLPVSKIQSEFNISDDDFKVVTQTLKKKYPLIPLNRMDCRLTAKAARGYFNQDETLASVEERLTRSRKLYFEIMEVDLTDTKEKLDDLEIYHPEMKKHHLSYTQFKATLTEAFHHLEHEGAKVTAMSVCDECLKRYGNKQEDFRNFLATFPNGNPSLLDIDFGKSRAPGFRMEHSGANVV